MTAYEILERIVYGADWERPEWIVIAREFLEASPDDPRWTKVKRCDSHGANEK